MWAATLLAALLLAADLLDDRLAVGLGGLLGHGVHREEGTHL